MPFPVLCGLPNRILIVDGFRRQNAVFRQTFETKSAGEDKFRDSKRGTEVVVSPFLTLWPTLFRVRVGKTAA